MVLADAGTRYAPVEPVQHRDSSESQGLAFHPPCGCSKGAAEQYVLDREDRPEGFVKAVVTT